MRPYRGYTGTIEFDEDDRVFHGRLVGIRGIVTYEAGTAEEIVTAFHDSVDDYLEDCTQRGVDADKPFSGNLSVRISSDLHRTVSNAAGSRAVSVNQWIAETLEHAARRDVESGTTVVKS